MAIHTNMTIDDAGLPPLTGPELASMRMDLIEGRLRSIEHLLAQLGRYPAEQDVILLTWRLGQLERQYFVATSIQTDPIDTAIDKLRAGRVAWVSPGDLDAVIAGAVAVAS